MFRSIRFAVIAFLMGTATVNAQTRPNIVMIVSDDQGWTDFGFMGHKHVKTPHLDKLASQSLLFRRGYVPSSLCSPSLASIISGKYPSKHKITGNDPAPANSPEFAKAREEMAKLIDGIPTLPRLLGRYGYLSFQSGKWWLGDFLRGGFTHGMTKGSRHGDDGLTIGRKSMTPIFEFIADAKKQERPFFVWYAPMMPHQPHNPPKRFLDKYQDKTPSEHVAKYWGMIEWFDETCGQLLDHLEKEGLAKNTIVVFVTDNGWIQLPGSQGFGERSKFSPYEMGHRTPIMIRWLDKAPARESAELASSIDFMPTLIKAVGGVVPADLPGIDLLDDAAVKGRKTIHGECYLHNILDLESPARNLLWRWTIDGHWKLIVPRTHGAKGELARIPAEPRLKGALKKSLESGAVELYDLATDPHEEKNLAAAHPERVAAILRKLDAHWTPTIPR